MIRRKGQENHEGGDDEVRWKEHCVLWLVYILSRDTVSRVFRELWLWLSWSQGHGLCVTKEMGFLGLSEDTDGVPGLTGTGLTGLF